MSQQARQAAKYLRAARSGARKKGVSGRLRRLEKVTRDTSRNKKVWDYSNTITTLSLNNPLIHFPIIAQGSGQAQHLGNEFFWQDFALRYEITWTRIINNFNPHSVRIIFGLCRHSAGGASFTAANVMNELFGATNPYPNIMYALKQDGGLLGEKYIIIKDRLITRPQSTMFHMGEGPAAQDILNMSPARKYVQLRGSIKNNKAHFDESTSTSHPDKMMPFVLMFTDAPINISHNGGNELSIYAQERIFYTEDKVL